MAVDSANLYQLKNTEQKILEIELAEKYIKDVLVAISGLAIDADKIDAVYDELANIVLVADNIGDVIITADNIAEVVIVSNNIDDVVACANNIQAIINTSDNIAQVTAVGDDVILGAGTNQPTDSAILNALTNADSARADAVQTADDRVQTGLDTASSSTSASEALASKNLAEEWAISPNIVDSTGDSSKTWAGRAAAFSPTNNLVSIPNSNMTSGAIALSNTVSTLIFDAEAYTGNGTSKDVVTGIESCDFTVSGNGNGYWHDRVAGDCIIKNDAGTPIESGDIKLDVPISMVHLKNLDTATNHHKYDGIRGRKNRIFTDTTSAEAEGTTDVIESFNSDGVTLGSYAGINENTKEHILYQTLYTHIKWGLTNHSKRYCVAYNPKSNLEMPMWIGSGLAGHQIPSPIGVALDYLEIKDLDDSAYWWEVYYGSNESYLKLNETDAKIDSDERYDITASSIGLSSGNVINKVNHAFIGYGKAKSEVWTSGTYTGTGVAGNFIETKDSNGVARKPAVIKIKRKDSTGNWWLFDNKRSDKYLFMNTSGAEGTDDTIDFTSTGFVFNNTGAEYNGSGGLYHYEVYFDTNSDGGGSYDDLASDTTNVQLTDRGMMFTKGIVDGSAYNTKEFNTGTETITIANLQDGNNYVYKTEGGSYTATLDEPNIGSIGYGHSLLSGKGWSDYDYIADGSTNTSMTDSVPTMTSNTSPSGEASANAEYDVYLAYRVFDDVSTGDGWQTNTVTGYIQYKFNGLICINKYIITAPSSAPDTRCPKNWTVEASNTGLFSGEEVVLVTVTDEIGWTAFEKRTFTLSNSTEYKYYRINITANNGDATYTAIGELELIEAQLDAGTPLVDAITYLDKTIEYSAGEIVDTHDFKYADTVLGMVVQTGNRFLIDNDVVGTITINQRYTFEYPIPNTDYMDWDMKVQIFIGGKWSATGQGGTGSNQGLICEAMEEGLVIQTAINYIYADRNEAGLNTSGMAIGVTTSAPARIIATYKGVINA